MSAPDVTGSPRPTEAAAVTDAPAAPDQWRAFRAAREAELTEPHGWLTLRGFHWLAGAPSRIEGLPGLWWTDGEQGYVQAVAADGLVVDGAPLDGRAAKTCDDKVRVPWVTHGDVEVELLSRGGRFAVRLRAETSPAREAFAGVPTYPYDPAWVIDGRFEAYPEERVVDVATARDDLRQRIRAIGEVEFEAGGQRHRLVVTSIKAGLAVEFHDPTNGTETEAWRQLKFGQPDANGTVRMDFNETNNMWFAFTDHATCPAPAEGNVVSVPVRAGEKRARPVA